jgi:hypothetical protein
VAGYFGHGEGHSSSICRGRGEIAAFLTKLLAANFSKRTLIHGRTYS